MEKMRKIAVHACKVFLTINGFFFFFFADFNISKIFFSSSYPEVFLRKGVIKICSKCTEEYPYRSVILIK